MKRALTRVAGAIASIELPIVLLISPVLLFPSPRRLPLALLMPVVWLASRWARGTWIPATPINPGVAILLLMSGVSLVATFDVELSLGKVAGVWLGAFLFWGLVRYTINRTRLKVLTDAFVLAGAALAVIGLLGADWMTKFSGLAAFTASLPKLIRGIPGAENGFHPNAVAGCLVLFIPLQAFLVLDEIRSGDRGLGKVYRVSGYGISLGLTTATLLASQSRGGIIGLALGFVAATIWSGRPGRVAMAVLVPTAIALTFIAPWRVWDVALVSSGAGADTDVAQRVELWSRAVYAIGDFPATGMGMNTFREIVPVLYPTSLIPARFDVAHAHNHLLQAALDLGLPGLIGYLAIWIGVGAMLIRTYRGATARRDKILASGLGAAFVAHFTFGMVDAIPLGAKVGILFWLTLGVTASLHNVALGAADRLPASSRGNQDAIRVAG